MVMSTKEQETFETALVTPTSLDSIRAGLSKVDVRQVRMLYPVSSLLCEHARAVTSQGPELRTSL